MKTYYCSIYCIILVVLFKHSMVVKFFFKFNIYSILIIYLLLFEKKVTSEETSDAHKLDNSQKVEILTKLLKHLNNVETRFVHGRDLDLTNSDEDQENLNDELSTRFVHGRDLEDSNSSQLESSEEDNDE